MAALKGDDPEEDVKEELLDGFKDVNAHIIDVSLSEDQLNEESIFSHMASVDGEDERSSYILRLNYVSAFLALKDIFHDAMSATLMVA